MSDPRLERPYWRNRTNVDALTIAALEYAEKLAGCTFLITQGSYQSTVAESAGTHDRGGALDLAWTGDDSDILALRKAGFAAWHRTPEQGPWKDHIHAIVVDHPYLSPSAARQVVSYRKGRNGLANDAADDGPRLNPIPVFDYNAWSDDMPSPEETRAIVREEIAAALSDIGDERVVNPGDQGPGSRSLASMLWAQLRAQRATNDLLRDLVKANRDASKR